MESTDKRARVLFEAIPSSSRKNVPTPIIEMDSEAPARMMSVSAINLLNSCFLFE